MDGVGPQLKHAGLNLRDDPREIREQVESDVFGFWLFPGRCSSAMTA